MDSTEPTGVRRQDEGFYEGAYARIVRFMLVTAAVATAALWLGYGWRFGAAFALGCGLALLNFHWLKRVVAALADPAISTGEKQGTSGLVLRFLLRYLLVALAAYAIFRGSLLNVYGLLAGLFLPVAAIILEALYETYVALRRGW